MKTKQEPDFLCEWDFCTTCIAYRKKHKIKMPKLKPRDNGCATIPNRSLYGKRNEKV